jgi:hypothetical protein
MTSIIFGLMQCEMFFHGIAQQRVMTCLRYGLSALRFPDKKDFLHAMQTILAFILVPAAVQYNMLLFGGLCGIRNIMTLRHDSCPCPFPIATVSITFVAQSHFSYFFA